MAAVKAKLGRIPCDGCGHPTLVKENEHKTLTMQCDECDMSTFAKHGTACAARWRAKLPAAQAAQGPGWEPPAETTEQRAARSNRQGAAEAAATPKPAAGPFQSLFGIGGQ